MEKPTFLLPHWIGESHVILSPIEPWLFEVLPVMLIHVMKMLFSVKRAAVFMQSDVFLVNMLPIISSVFSSTETASRLEDYVIKKSVANKCMVTFSVQGLRCSPCLFIMFTSCSSYNWTQIGKVFLIYPI